MRTAGIGSVRLLRELEQATRNVAAVYAIAPQAGSLIGNPIIYRDASGRQVPGNKLIGEVEASSVPQIWRIRENAPSTTVTRVSGRNPASLRQTLAKKNCLPVRHFYAPAFLVFSVRICFIHWRMASTAPGDVLFIHFSNRSAACSRFKRKSF
jgi:hypothetical protein